MADPSAESGGRGTGTTPRFGLACLTDPASLRAFEATVLPHLDAAYNLARWLTRSPDDAEDVVQEACLRALRYYRSFHGESARTWLLTIVRNTCFTWLRNNRDRQEVPLFDDDHADDPEGGDTPGFGSPDSDPETIAIRSADRALLNRLIGELRCRFARCWCCASWKICPTRRSPKWRRCRSAR
jgi:RNA polymerase sigma-70 factor (ECF subfamily)